MPTLCPNHSCTHRSNERTFVYFSVAHTHTNIRLKIHDDELAQSLHPTRTKAPVEQLTEADPSAIGPSTTSPGL